RNSLGKVYLEKGDYPRAAAYFDDNLADATLHGFLFEISRAHINAGIAALRSGDSDTAESHYRAGLAAAREHGDVRHRASCLRTPGCAPGGGRAAGAAPPSSGGGSRASSACAPRPWRAGAALAPGALSLALGAAGRAGAMGALADRLSADVATTSVIRENL